MKLPRSWRQCYSPRATHGATCAVVSCARDDRNSALARPATAVEAFVTVLGVALLPGPVALCDERIPCGFGSLSCLALFHVGSPGQPRCCQCCQAGVHGLAFVAPSEQSHGRRVLADVLPGEGNPCLKGYHSAVSFGSWPKASVLCIASVRCAGIILIAHRTYTCVKKRMNGSISSWGALVSSA